MKYLTYVCFGAVSSAPSYRPVRSPDSEMVNALLPVEIVAPAMVTLVDVTFGIERDVVVVVDDPPEDVGLNIPVHENDEPLLNVYLLLFCHVKVPCSCSTDVVVFIIRLQFSLIILPSL